MSDLRCSAGLFLFLLVSITALGPLAMQIIVPAIPTIGVDMGVDEGTAQLVLTLSMVAIACANLIYGPVSDRYGRRPVLLFGLTLYIAASAYCVVAPTIELLIAGRILQAAGATSGMVLSRAIIRDVYDRRESAKMIAYVTVGMVAAPMVAPALGGALTEAVGWRMNFAVVGVVGVVICAIAIVWLWETHPRRPSGSAEPEPLFRLGPMVGSFATLLRIPEYRGYVFQSTFAMASFFCFVGGAPHVMEKVLGRPADEYGYYFVMVAGSFMVGNFVSARIVKRMGIDRMVVIGSVLSLIGVSLSIGLFAAGIWAPLCIFGPGALIAIGNGLSMPNSGAGAVSVDPEIAGAASGLMGFLQMSVAAAFAQLVAELFDMTPWPMLLLMGLTTALSLIVFLLQRGRRPGPAAETAD